MFIWFEVSESLDSCSNVFIVLPSPCWILCLLSTCLIFSFSTHVTIFIVYCKFRMIPCRGSEFCSFPLKNIDFFLRRKLSCFKFQTLFTLQWVSNEISSIFSLPSLAFHRACWSLPRTSEVQEQARFLKWCLVGGFEVSPSQSYLLFIRLCLKFPATLAVLDSVLQLLKPAKLELSCWASLI